MYTLFLKILCVDLNLNMKMFQRHFQYFERLSKLDEMTVITLEEWVDIEKPENNSLIILLFSGTYEYFIPDLFQLQYQTLFFMKIWTPLTLFW